MALSSDLAVRIAEPTGLLLEDIHLDAPIPYVTIRPQPWRSLKNDESEREVPLVGLSLWAAKRIKETARDGQIFAFPRYCNDQQCKATHASNTINKWLRSDSLALSCKEHGSKDFRHTMADRLRAVECPVDLRFRIGGWSLKKQGHAEGYGLGHQLKLMNKYLSKVVL